MRQSEIAKLNRRKLGKEICNTLGSRAERDKRNKENAINKKNGQKERNTLVMEVYKILPKEWTEEQLQVAIEVVIQKNPNCKILLPPNTANPKISLYNWFMKYLKEEQSKEQVDDGR